MKNKNISAQLNKTNNFRRQLCSASDLLVRFLRLSALRCPGCICPGIIQEKRALKTYTKYYCVILERKASYTGQLLAHSGKKNLLFTVLAYYGIFCVQYDFFLFLL